MKKLEFNIIEKRKILFAIPIAIMLIGLVFLFIRGGFNMDIDFVGGTTMQIELHKQVEPADTSAIDGIVKEAIGQNASYIQSAGDQKTEVLIKTKELTTEQRDDIFAKIKEKYNLVDDDRLSVDNVSSAVGKDLQKSAVIATVLAVALMLCYISFRFELRSGIAAVLALIHDMFIILSIYAIFDLPMNITFIAAILTILGYSINATIIVFDRVRENRQLEKKTAFADTLNKSVWQTLNRSINTSLTTLFTILALYILGVQSIKVFALPIIVGIVSGAYSSIFLSANFWFLLSKDHKRQTAK